MGHAALISRSLSRTALYFVLTKLVLITAKEHAQSMGWNVLDSEVPFTNMCSILNGSESNHLKLLVGSGMHLKVESAWVFFILSNLVRVPRLEVRDSHP